MLKYFSENYSIEILCFFSLFFLCLEYFLVYIFGKIKIFIGRDAVRSYKIAYFLGNLGLIACSVFSCICFLSAMLSPIISSSDTDLSDWIAAIVAVGCFHVFITSTIYRIFFDDDANLPIKVDILLCEYNYCIRTKDNRKAVAKWVSDVYDELKRFRLESSMLGKLTSKVKKSASNIAKRGEKEKDEENFFTEENIQEIASGLLMLAGKKEVALSFKFHEEANTENVQQQRKYRGKPEGKKEISVKSSEDNTADAQIVRKEIERQYSSEKAK